MCEIGKVLKYQDLLKMIQHNNVVHVGLIDLSARMFNADATRKFDELVPKTTDRLALSYGQNKYGCAIAWYDDESDVFIYQHDAASKYINGHADAICSSSLQSLVDAIPATDLRNVFESILTNALILYARSIGYEITFGLMSIVVSCDLKECYITRRLSDYVKHHGVAVITIADVCEDGKFNLPKLLSLSLLEKRLIVEDKRVGAQA
jgi:hypothetical protein